jgi:hypothetical protein
MAARFSVKIVRFESVLLLVFFMLSACASKSYLVGGGAQTPAIAKLSDSPDASAAILAPLYYPVGARVQSKNERTSFYVSVDFNPYPAISPERGVHQFHSQLRLGISPPYATLGPIKGFLVSSAHINWQRGLGESVILGNGESISVFYTPSESRFSQTLNLGAELAVFLNNQWMLSPGIVVEAPLSSNRRQYSAYINLWYKWRGANL